MSCHNDIKKIVNKLVRKFLVDHDVDPCIISDWESTEMQKSLKSRLSNKGVNLMTKSKYRFFCEDERNKILQEFPGKKLPEITCILTQRWNDFKESTDPDDILRMKKYEMLNKKDSERVLEEKQSFQAEDNSIVQGAYNAFCKISQSENPDISVDTLHKKWTNVRNDSSLLEHYYKNSS